MALGDVDRLGIVLGDAGSLAANLRDCAPRSDGAGAAEWRGRLKLEQGAIVDAVETLLRCDDVQGLPLLGQIDVAIVTETVLDRTSPIWMPEGPDPSFLNGHLRDLVGGGART